MMHTMEEWAAYLQSLSGQELWSKTIAMNTQSFARDLRDEGFTMADVKAILLLCVQQMKVQGVVIPGNGLFDLIQMSQIS